MRMHNLSVHCRKTCLLSSVTGWVVKAKDWAILECSSTLISFPPSSVSKGNGTSAESNQHFAGETENTKESLQIISECNCS